VLKVDTIFHVTKRMIPKAFFSHHLICGICISHHVASLDLRAKMAFIYIAKNGTRNLSVDISLREMAETDCYEVSEYCIHYMYVALNHCNIGYELRGSI
jgi:hypothetical protein